MSFEISTIGIVGMISLLVVLTCLDLLFDFSPEKEPVEHESEEETARRLTGTWNHRRERKDTD